MSMIYSYNNVSENGYQVGYYVDKDMDNDNYTNEFNPGNYPEMFSATMTPFIDENIVAGDKNEIDRLNASYWVDWDDDVFDDWGYLYLYDDTSGTYYFPLLDPVNQDDGVFSTQTFNVFGRTFTIQHGYPVQGIFKIDISVNDSLPFRFGAYGNMGSDDDTQVDSFTQPYSIHGSNLNLYYYRNSDGYTSVEKLFVYCIPRKVSENASQTYELFHDGRTNTSIVSNPVTNGCLFYFAKTYDVKDWVLADLSATGPVDMTCFKEDTQILTDKGYVPVQNLRTGDLVQTVSHGFQPIFGIGSKDIAHLALRDDRIKDQLYVCSPNRFSQVTPAEPLVITGCHSILEKEFVSQQQREDTIAVNGKIYVTDNHYRIPACVHHKTDVYPVAGKYTIYHFALENDESTKNYGVYANGLLVETCSKRYFREFSGLCEIH